MTYAETLLGLLPPVSYARNAPKIRAQAQIDGKVLDDVRQTAETALAALDPRTAGDMLPDWERLLDLDARGKNRQQRVLAVMAEINETGGLSIPYFVRLAASIGYEIEISEPQPFRAGISRAGERIAPPEIIWVWWVNVKKGSNKIIRFRAGLSAAGGRLTDFGDAEIESIFRNLKPAHTDVHFTYEA